jgi:transcriptional regulator with XRE-family HTH domain
MTTITPAVLDLLMRDLGLTPAQLARRIGVSESAVSRWRSGRNEPQGLYAARLRELRVLADHQGPRGHLDLAALANTLLDRAAPLAGPDSADYERGFREGYREAAATVLRALTGLAPTLTTTPQEQQYDRHQPTAPNGHSK